MKRLRKVVDERLYRIAIMAEKAGRKNDSRFWLAVAQEIMKPRETRAEINLGQVSRLTSSGETVVIPGKLLGDGEIEHPVRISSISVSSSALKKLIKAGGEYISIEKLILENPKGKNLKLLR
ncbi:MAG: 50S ribosomal protein L18e [Thermoproteota archaeon]